VDVVGRDAEIDGPRRRFRLVHSGAAPQRVLDMGL
jgi:hypothetical protein